MLVPTDTEKNHIIKHKLEDEILPTTPELKLEDEILPTTPELKLEDEILPTTPELKLENDILPTTLELKLENDILPTTPDLKLENDILPTTTDLKLDNDNPANIPGLKIEEQSQVITSDCKQDVVTALLEESCTTKDDNNRLNSVYQLYKPDANVRRKLFWDCIQRFNSNLIYTRPRPLPIMVATSGGIICKDFSSMPERMIKFDSNKGYEQEPMELDAYNDEEQEEADMDCSDIDASNQVQNTSMVCSNDAPNYSHSYDSLKPATPLMQKAKLNFLTFTSGTQKMLDVVVSGAMKSANNETKPLIQRAKLDFLTHGPGFAASSSEMQTDSGLPKPLIHNAKLGIQATVTDMQVFHVPASDGMKAAAAAASSTTAPAATALIPAIQKSAFSFPALQPDMYMTYVQATVPTMQTISQNNNTLAVQAMGQNSSAPTVPAMGQNSSAPTVQAMGQISSAPTVSAMGQNSSTPAVPAMGQNSSAPAVPAMGQNSSTPAVPAMGQNSSTPAVPAMGLIITPDISAMGLNSSVPAVPAMGQNSSVPAAPAMDQNNNASAIPPMGQNSTPDIPAMGENSCTSDIPAIDQNITADISAMGQNITPDIPAIGQNITPDIPAIGENSNARAATLTTVELVESACVTMENVPRSAAATVPQNSDEPPFVIVITPDTDQPCSNYDVTKGDVAQLPVVMSAPPEAAHMYVADPQNDVQRFIDNQTPSTSAQDILSTVGVEMPKLQAGIINTTSADAGLESDDDDGDDEADTASNTVDDGSDDDDAPVVNMEKSKNNAHDDKPNDSNDEDSDDETDDEDSDDDEPLDVLGGAASDAESEDDALNSDGEDESWYPLALDLKRLPPLLKEDESDDEEEFGAPHPADPIPPEAGTSGENVSLPNNPCPVEAAASGESISLPANDGAGTAGNEEEDEGVGVMASKAHIDVPTAPRMHQPLPVSTHIFRYTSTTPISTHSPSDTIHSL